MKNATCCNGHHVRVTIGAQLCPAIVHGEPCDGALRVTSRDPRWSSVEELVAA